MDHSSSFYKRTGQDSPVLVDVRGEPMKKSMLTPGSSKSYSSAGWDRELASWNPINVTPDIALNYEAGTIVARTQDLIRNNGLASGIVTSFVDSVLGTTLRSVPKPDWQALGWEQKASEDWSRTTEALFRAWAYDETSKYSDAARRTTLFGRQAMALRAFMTYGESMSTAEWIKRKGSPFNTAIQMINPDRVCNPNFRPDSSILRRGIELDSYGAAIAYNVLNGHPSESLFYSDPNAFQWVRVKRETTWGRSLFLHVYDPEYAGQSRGKPTFATILSKMKMFEKMQQAALQNMIINAIYAATFESSLDTASVVQALGGAGSSNENALEQYLTMMADFNKGTNVQFDGVKIPHLFPGEKLNLSAPKNPGVGFSDFESSVLRYLAAGTNMTYEQVSKDYSKTNYSSSRAASTDAYRTVLSRRNLIPVAQANFEYALWLEEAVNNGSVKIPKGLPSFYEMKSAWCRLHHIGQGRDHIDPVKDATANDLDYKAARTNLEILCAEDGRDWKEVLTQRAAEKEFMEQLGLTPQDFAGANPMRISDNVSPANPDAQPPEPDGNQDGNDNSEDPENQNQGQRGKGAPANSGTSSRKAPPD